MESEVKVLASSEDAGCLNLLALVLQNQKNITLIGEAANWRELSSLVTTLQPDVVLLDTDAHGNGAAAVIRTAKLKRLPTAFVGLVGELDVESVLLNQLDALILKSDPLREMVSTILAVASKGKYSQRGYGTGIKPSFMETRRQYPTPESRTGLPSSSIPHQTSETPFKDQTTPPASPRPSAPAKPENSHIEPAKQDENARKPEGPEASGVQGAKQSSTTVGDSIERFESIPNQTQHRDGDDGILASRLDAMRAALGNGFAISAPTPATNGSIEAGKPETVATITEEATDLSTEPVDLEPLQEPPTVQPPDNGVESTLKEILPSAGSIVLIASPFGNFRSLGNFQQALEKLDGVRSMRVRRFQGGTLYAVIRYAGTIEQLEGQLKDLVQFDPRIIEAKPGAIELRINPGNGQPSDE